MHRKSPYIETEHLLLGLLREDRALGKWCPGESNAGPEIRSEIEKRITRGERFSTSVEVPLTAECKKVLTLAAEASDKLGHGPVETEHISIGILQLEASLAAQILIARGVKPGAIQEQLAKAQSRNDQSRASTTARLTLTSLRAGLTLPNSEELVSFFAMNAEVIDATGKKWDREEIRKGLETLFALYAKKNASYIVEAILAKTSELFVANILWKNALLASEHDVCPRVCAVAETRFRWAFRASGIIQNRKTTGRLCRVPSRSRVAHNPRVVVPSVLGGVVLGAM
jgi:hypothetical protein